MSRAMFPTMPPNNHALQRTGPSRSGCNRPPLWAGSLSLGLGDFASMKRPRIFALVAALLAGCSKPTAPTETPAPEAASAPVDPARYPVLIIDEQHQIRGSNPPAAYQI